MGSSEVGEDIDENALEQSETVDPSTSSQARLYNKLRAVEFEIDAVASTVKPERKILQNKDNAYDGDGSTEQGAEEDGPQDSSIELDLHHALATDRLRSLKKTKAQIEKELSGLRKSKPSKGVEHERSIFDIVKEEPRPKRKLKEVKKTGKSSEKRHKTVSFDEDDDFNAALDAASTGFVETVS